MKSKQTTSKDISSAREASSGDDDLMPDENGGDVHESEDEDLPEIDDEDGNDKLEEEGQQNKPQPAMQKSGKTQRKADRRVPFRRSCSGTKNQKKSGDDL